MGKLIKNHWARLLTLAAASYHLLASFECFFWPKIFFDPATKLLDIAVKPVPILQTINLVLCLLIIAWEYPLGWISGTPLHRSMEARLIVLPLVALASILMYQGTNASLYYVISIAVWFWAFAEGEEVCPTPWTVPKKKKVGV